MESRAVSSLEDSLLFNCLLVRSLSSRSLLFNWLKFRCKAKESAAAPHVRLRWCSGDGGPDSRAPQAWMREFAWLMSFQECGLMYRCSGFNRKRLPLWGVGGEGGGRLQRHRHQTSASRQRMPNHAAANQHGGLSTQLFGVNITHVEQDA